MSVKGTFVGDMTLKICFIVGEEYANHCGVKDYAIRLADALERMGATVNVCAAPTWGAKDSLSFCHRLRATNYDIVHIQYPSIGYRSSLWPHILGCFTARKRTVVTVHEYSALRSVQRLSTHIFRWTTSQLLFTTEFEAGRFRNSIGARDQVQKVVPIGSNVPTYSLELERAPNVIYFGQIRPERGIEEFLSLARLCLALSRPFKFMVVGSAPKKHADYSQRLRAQAPSGVEWLVDLDLNEVAKVMAGSLTAYLPFPDGASYRRGSLLAAMNNGLPVISRKGAATAPELLNGLMFADSVVEALARLDALYVNPAYARSKASEARILARKFAWEVIALRHAEIYNAMLSRRELSTESKLAF